MIAIGDHGGIVVNARLSAELFDCVCVKIDAPVRREQRLKAVPKNGTGDMTGLVWRRINMRINDPHLRVVQMFGNPLRVNQHLRMCVVCH